MVEELCYIMIYLVYILIWDIEFDVFLNNYDFLDIKFILK